MRLYSMCRHIKQFCDYSGKLLDLRCHCKCLSSKPELWAKSFEFCSKLFGKHDFFYEDSEMHGTCVSLLMNFVFVVEMPTAQHGGQTGKQVT